MGYGLLADLIVALHVAYVSYILVGQLAVVVGGLLKWNWVRNFWFRVIHLVAITIVALEAIFGIDCPLTVWENRLRQMGGQEVTGETFIGRWLHQLIFYHFPPWAFSAVYIGFAVLVFGSFFLVPPRPRKGTMAGGRA